MPADTAVAPKLTVKMDGSALEPRIASQLIEFTVDHRRNAPDLFRLVFHDPQLTLVDLPTFKVGAEAHIAIEVDPQARGVLTEGEVTSLTLEDNAWGTQLIVQGMDRSHALFRERRAEVHLNVKYSDVVTTIAGRAGLRAQADATATVHPYLSQNGLTDWEFLQMMADEVGFDVWTEGRTLHFAAAARASAPVAELERGKNLVHLTVVASGGGEHAKQVQVRGWDPATQRAVVSESAANATPGAQVGIGAPSQVRGSFDNGKVVLTRTPVRTANQADKLAKAAAESMASGYLEVTGAASGDPRLKARAAVKVTKAGTRFSGTYVLTEVRHIWETEAGYRTEFTATGRHDRSLYALASGYNSFADASPARMTGLAIGIVTNLRDPENQGRVKVAMPWLADSHESNWARVAQLLGSNGHGSLLMPDVNDEVLLGFEHGDINQPYVLGTLYSKKQLPDKAVKSLLASDGTVASQRIETRSHNRLVFYDHSSKQGITLRTGDDKYYLDLNKTDTKITVSSDGDVTIQATRGKVFVEAKDMELKASGTLKAESTGAATFKSSAKMTVEGAAGLELKSSGVVEIKGAVVKLN
jgi:phage protein D